MIDWKIRPEYLEKSVEQRYVDVIKNLDNVVLDIVKKNKILEEQNAEKDTRVLELQETIDNLNKQIVFNNKFIASITPLKVFYHKNRKNTTVKFLDGESVTVKLCKGDKDCLETAIVYAIFKKNKNYNKRLLKYLIETADIVGGKK